MSSDVRPASAGGGTRQATALAPQPDRVSWKVLLPAIVVLAMVGAALGLLSSDWREALNLVSKVLIAIAVVLGLLAAVQLLRTRAATQAFVDDRDATDRTDVVEVETQGQGVGFADDSVEISPVQLATVGAPARSIPPSPVEPVRAPTSEPTPAEEPVPAASAEVEDLAAVEARADVLDAIAPYAEVVGQPVFYDDRPTPPPSATTSPVVAPTVPPPPPFRPSGVVPPPPPPLTVPAPPAAVVPTPVASPIPIPTPVVAAPAPVAPVVAATPEPAPTAADAAPLVDAGELDAAARASELAEARAASSATSEAVQTDLVVDDGDALVPSADVPGWSRSSAFPAARGAAMPFASGASAEMAARSAVGSVAPVIVYRYRKWVLGQMVPGAPFEPVTVDRTPDEWLLLSTCGVATLMAWTHEDHHFTYPVETWADEILPAHGVRIRDRQLAVDLLLAAALHAGGIDAVPSERLRAYQPGDLVTAMASIHVGLLRLYCGLGRIGPERVLADQYGIGPGDIPLH